MGGNRTPLPEGAAPSAGTPTSHYPTPATGPLSTRPPAGAAPAPTRLRDLAAMVLERGIAFTHEAPPASGYPEWEERFAPLLTDRLRARRRGLARTRWFVDETYVWVQGRLCYLYRADRPGRNLVDSMLSEHRDMDAAKRFFSRSLEVVGHAPEKVTTDGHDAYPRAIREALGQGVSHRCSQYRTIVSSRTTGASRGATSPCAGSGASSRRRASAWPTTRCATTSATASKMHEFVLPGVQREQYRARSALRAMLGAA